MIENIFFIFLGIIIGYVIRLFVEDTDNKYDMMTEYQDIISDMVKELEDE